MKEEEIRRREAHNRYLDLVRQDSETLARDRSQFERIACPACGGSYTAAEIEKSGFTYEQCRECDTLFANPRPQYDALMQIYAASESTRYWVEEFFRPMAEVRREKIFRPRAEYIASRFPQIREGRTGDIGAGFGLFLEELRPLWSGADLWAIEPSEDMAAICREKEFPVLQTMLEDVGPEIERFDLLTAFELFEHLHDPLTFLQRVHALLRPGGYLFLTTLNGLGFDIQLLWERSKSVSPPHHLNFANPWSMRMLLERAGFGVEEASTPGELDWDIVEGVYRHEGTDPGRLFSTVARYATAESKQALQNWIRDSSFSSHMRIIARKEEE